MKKNKFSLGTDELKSYISGALGMDVDDEKLSKFKKKSNSDEKEEDLDNLTSLNTQSKNIEKNITRRVVFVLILIPTVVFFGVVFYKTSQLMQKDSVRIVPKDGNSSKKLGLAMNTTFQWRVLKDQQIEDIKNNVNELKTSLHKDLNTTLQTVKKQLAKNSEVISSQLSAFRKDFEGTKDELISKINETTTQQEYLKAKIENQKKDILKIVKNTNFSKSKLDDEINLPKLPALKKDFTHKNEHAKTSNNNVAKTKEAARDEKEAARDEKEAARDEYVEVSADISSDSMNYETQDFTKSQKDQNVTLDEPDFTLMPGFVKGTLLNGGEMPVLTEGDDTSEAVPVYIRLNDNELIANESSVNINGCFIIATAKGNLSKRAVELRLSKISCNVTDMEGNNYKIDQKIEGWVFDENGDYGVKGRLVSREGEIIKAGLPLAIVESMIQSLSMAIGNANSTTIVSSTENPAAVNTQYMSGGLAQGAGTGTSKVLKKFSDYYLKMLDSLNPTISIRAGRNIVVAFKGGETLHLKAYKPISIEYFTDDEENFDEEIDDE